jgi:hypothetical protein
MVRLKVNHSWYEPLDSPVIRIMRRSGSFDEALALDKHSSGCQLWLMLGRHAAPTRNEKRNGGPSLSLE